MSVYKSRGSPFAPLYLCTGSQSRAHGCTKQGRERMPERKTTRAKPRPEAQREQEVKVDSPGKTLAGVASAAPTRALPGQLAQHQQSEPPLSPRVPNAANNYIGPRAREAPLWWHADLCQDQEYMRSDENQKTTTLGGILAVEIHKDPGKHLAEDDCSATARPLPGPPARPLPRTPAGPQPGPRLPRCHRRSHAAASSPSWTGTCVATDGLYTDSTSTCVVACQSS